MGLSTVTRPAVLVSIFWPGAAVPARVVLGIEPEGAANKVLRITLPLGMQLSPGTRVIVDNGQPMNAPYMTCFPNGCMADYEASSELIGKMKKSQSMVVQGINSQGQAISLVALMGRIPATADPDGGLARAMAGGRVIGLCRLEDGMLKPERVL